MLSQINM